MDGVVSNNALDELVTTALQIDSLMLGGGDNPSQQHRDKYAVASLALTASAEDIAKAAAELLTWRKLHYDLWAALDEAAAGAPNQKERRMYRALIERLPKPKGWR